MSVGTHIGKGPTFFSSLKDFFTEEVLALDNGPPPCQIFTGSPKTWARGVVTTKDLEQTVSLIKEYSLRVYVHSVYFINLCNTSEEFNQKALKNLRWEMENSFKLGFRGVVVHCGKSVGCPQEEALDRMHKNILSVLPYTSSKCPIMIETSAGQGTELLYKVDDYIEFYDRFTSLEKEKVKLCIDTCHVFAAGHDPYEFLLKVEEEHPDSVQLIHFNDSKHKRGERKDRHAFPGTGYIGNDILNQVKEWANDNDVPLIIE